MTSGQDELTELGANSNLKRIATGLGGALFEAFCRLVGCREENALRPEVSYAAFV